ncbi:hypothetical protein [Erythrobacter sp.]|uniref:hypothetical protein n=1 Tax=Erythrobacter sp. TaxID=1042 RepID=UPI001425F922|nr:hypothetical protein [Erythrobacter sp.]QIQ86233.1 MAG: hypothetical protein G9473_05695 [Erythrobacter sp.]
MTHKFIKAFAPALALAACAASPAFAQDAAAPADTPETRQHAVENMTLLMSALNSEAVEAEVKNVLMGCIYNNSMRQITVAMDNAIAANPEQFDRTDSGVMLGVMAGICGYQAQPGGAASEAPAQPR